MDDLECEIGNNLICDAGTGTCGCDAATVKVALPIERCQYSECKNPKPSDACIDPAGE